MGVLEVRDLVKRYGPSVGVGPVSFQIEEAEFISLLGPSGCGKTTTLRCIAGFEQPSEGDILLDGESIVSKPPHRRDMGLVFQTYALFPHLTVFENVAFGLHLRRRPRAEIVDRVGKALSQVNLLGFEARRPSQLSGGQQQRVALARSLVLQPKILLLDEPLSNLDLKLRLQMRGELKALQQRLRITAIYVTHDREEALTLSDRVIVLSRGIVQQVGTPREIYETPRTPFVADFIGASNLLPGRVEEIYNNNGEVTVQVAGLRLRSRNPVPPEAGLGKEVVVLLRPERIRLALGGETSTPSDNVLPATVTGVIYLGEDLQVELELKGGPTLTASLKAGATEKELVSGDQVVAHIAVRDVRLLPRVE